MMLEEDKIKNLPEHIAKMHEYAGEQCGKHRFRDIVYFKKTGNYPTYLTESKSKSEKSNLIRHFLVAAHNCELSNEKVSPISSSKLLFSIAEGDIRVIPYLHEIDHVLQALHIEEGKHIGITNAVKRAKKFKVYWPGYTSEMELYIMNCICRITGKFKRKDKLNRK